MKYLLYPDDYKKSTQVVFFQFLASKLDLMPLSYSDFYVNSKIRSIDKLLVFKNFIFFGVKSSIYFRRNSIKIDGINLSHAIIESYLRFNLAYQFKKNITFFKLLYKSILIKFKFENNCSKIGLLVGGDEAYVWGSILGQLCEKRNIPNIFFKDYNGIYGFRFNPEKLYAGVSNFKLSDISTSDLDLDKADLFLKGLLENDTSYVYMKKRFFRAIDPHYFKTNDFYHVLYLHDFVDSPGVYGESLFFDIPSWVKFCALAVKTNKERLLIKTHPNAKAINLELIKKLCKDLSKENHIEFIDFDFNLAELNKVIKIKSVLTIYGSVVYEAAYLGVNSIVCGNAPANFFLNVSQICKTKEELFSTIQNIKPLSKIQKNNLKNDVVFARAAFDYFLDRSKVAQLPYDFIDSNIFALLFNHSYDLNYNRHDSQTWSDSRRLENYMLEQLNLNEDCIQKVIKISGFVANNSKSKQEC